MFIRILSRYALLIAFSLLLLSAWGPVASIFPFDDRAPDSGMAPNPGTRPPKLPGRLSNQTYRVNVDLVNILCSVFDKNTNSFTTSLTREDFTVYEDGKKQVIENFARETDLPLTLAMLIDTSGSVAPKLSFEQEAAISFFQEVLSEKDRGMLVEFATGVNLVQDFTNDPNKLAEGISALRAAGGTSLYDAIFLSCDEKLIRATGRKAIIILSDGNDESSRHTLQQAKEMALRAEAMIFVISVSKGGFSGVNNDTSYDNILTELATDTGGRVFFPFKLEELYETFHRINQELRSQYSIGYTSQNTDRNGGYRKIEVKVQGGDFKLNYRQGYYAPES
jgi:Ca-activated chloride channel family protein